MGSIYTLIWQISSKVFSILYLPFGFVKKKKKKSLQQSQNSFPPVLQIAFQVKELVLMLIKTDKMIDVLYKTTLYVNLPSKTIFFGGGGRGLAEEEQSGNLYFYHSVSVF